MWDCIVKGGKRFVIKCRVREIDVWFVANCQEKEMYIRNVGRKRVGGVALFGMS